MPSNWQQEKGREAFQHKLWRSEHRRMLFPSIKIHFPILRMGCSLHRGCLPLFMARARLVPNAGPKHAGLSVQSFHLEVMKLYGCGHGSRLPGFNFSFLPSMSSILLLWEALQQWMLMGRCELPSLSASRGAAAISSDSRKWAGCSPSPGAVTTPITLLSRRICL